jgi:hypothetical protein
VRRALLLGVAALAFPLRAHAALPVFDATALAQSLKNYSQLAAQYARQGEQLIQAEETVRWQIQQFVAFVQNPSLGAALGLMNQAGLSGTLPVNLNALQDLFSGYGGGLQSLAGKLGSLGNLANNAYGQNHIYTCTDSYFACQQRQDNANGIAGAQGVALQAAQDIQAHLPVMQALRQNLLAATTPAQREQAMGQLQAESAWASAEAGQIQIAMLMKQSQKDADQQRAEEKIDQDLDEVIQTAKSNGDQIP